MADADQPPDDSADDLAADGAAPPGDASWLDATASDELLETAADHLRHQQQADDDSWGITAIEGFHGYPVAPHEDLRQVAAIARGIARHGPAFAAWAATRTEDVTEAAFAAAYLGTYLTVGAWAERIGRDLELLERARAGVPDAFRDYVRIDYEGLARDAWMSERVRLLRRPRGGIWVFADTP